jgi:hypothetical protein
MRYVIAVAVLTCIPALTLADGAMSSWTPMDTRIAQTACQKETAINYLASGEVQKICACYMTTLVANFAPADRKEDRDSPVGQKLAAAYSSCEEQVKAMRPQRGKPFTSAAFADAFITHRKSQGWTESECRCAIETMPEEISPEEFNGVKPGWTDADIDRLMRKHLLACRKAGK